MSDLQFIVTHETDNNGKPYNTPFTIHALERGIHASPKLISAWRHSDYTWKALDWKALDRNTQETIRIRRRYKSDAVDVALFYATIAWHNVHPHP